MLSLNIHRICAARGILQPFAYLKKHGFTHAIASYIVTNNYLQPKLAYLEKLCILLKCTPHDLLEWKPAADQNHDIPLATLIPKDANEFEWMQTIKKLPLDELRALGDVVKGTLH